MTAFATCVMADGNGHGTTKQRRGMLARETSSPLVSCAASETRAGVTALLHVCPVQLAQQDHLIDLLAPFGNWPARG
jgi:hypothetical protein